MTDHALTATRYRNALIGLAAGDAWGYQVEFLHHHMLPEYPGVPAPESIWRISDDTQMTLALHEALLDVADRLDDTQAVTDAITDRFLAWDADPDNNRAPGASCRASLAALRTGTPWHDTHGAVESHGCGAVMRLMPAALNPSPAWRAITALQAVITHKNSRAVASSLLLAEAIRYAPALRGHFLEHAIAGAMTVLTGENPWLHDQHLAAVLAPITADLAGYLAEGVNDHLCDVLLDAYAVKKELAGLEPHEFGDPCLGIGQGWEAASATALGLLVADLATAPGRQRSRLNGRSALQWAATSNGDSDSIASIAGAVIGSAHTSSRYWSGVKVHPAFEPRYAAEIRKAPAQWRKAFTLT